MINGEYIYDGLINEDVLPLLNRIKRYKENKKPYQFSGFRFKAGVAPSVINFLHNERSKGNVVKLKLFADCFQHKRIRRGECGYEFFFKKEW